jgi:hypothetical protein
MKQRVDTEPTLKRLREYNRFLKQEQEYFPKLECCMYPKPVAKDLLCLHKVQEELGGLLNSYVEKHFKVFPVQPLTKHYGKDRKTGRNGYPVEIYRDIPKKYKIETFEVIETRTNCEILWNALKYSRQKGKQWNWILATGRNSDCFVIDFDDYEEGREIKKLFAMFPWIQELAPRSKTPSGGEHIYLPYLPLVPSAKIREVIDLQSDGSLIVLPPSKTISKVTGEEAYYEWLRPPSAVSRKDWETLRSLLLENFERFMVFAELNTLPGRPKKRRRLAKKAKPCKDTEVAKRMKALFGIPAETPILVEDFEDEDARKFTLAGNLCLVRNVLRKTSTKPHTDLGKSSVMVFKNGAYKVHCWSCDRERNTKLPHEIYSCLPTLFKA